MLVDSMSRPLAAPPPAARLLAWYDAHRRTLPWRAAPEAPPPDPYAVWLSEVMLQQTTVAAVKPYYARFLDRWQNLWWIYAPAPGRPDPVPAWEGGSDEVFTTLDTALRALRSGTDR